MISHNTELREEHPAKVRAMSAMLRGFEAEHRDLTTADAHKLSCMPEAADQNSTQALPDWIS